MPNIPFSEVVKRHRKNRGMTREDVAKVAQLPTDRIRMIEEGDYCFKGVHQIENLCDALRMNSAVKKIWIYEMSEYVQIPEYIYSPHQVEKHK